MDTALLPGCLLNDIPLSCHFERTERWLNEGVRRTTLLTEGKNLMRNTVNHRLSYKISLSPNYIIPPLRHRNDIYYCFMILIIYPESGLEY